MLLDQRIPDRLDLSMLPLPPSIPVVEIRVADHTDWYGEPALRVTVIVNESVDVNGVTGDAVSDLKSAIRDRLRKDGITLFAYIYLVKQSELDAPDDGEA